MVIVVVDYATPPDWSDYLAANWREVVSSGVMPGPVWGM